MKIHPFWIRPKPIPRRELLKGVGVSLALPFLEAMAQGAQESEPPAKRMVVFMNDLGMLPQNFFPEITGQDYEDTRYTSRLKQFRKHLTILSGTAHPSVNGAHDSDQCFLTGTQGVSSPTFHNGISLDQYASRFLGINTRYPLLTTSNHPGKSLTFTQSGAKIPAVNNPEILYQLLFVDDSRDTSKLIQSLDRKKSLLDSLMIQTKMLDRKVGRSDRNKLDQFYSAIRQAEQDLIRSRQWAGIPKPKLNLPRLDSAEYQDDIVNITLVFQKLVALAFQTDQTRVATILISGAFGAKGMIDEKQYQLHAVSHHNHDPNMIELMARYEEMLLSNFNQFLSSLSESDENGTPLFESTVSLFGSCLSDANRHTTSNLPIILAGGGFKHQGHMKMSDDNQYPLSNLFVTILQQLGIPVDQFSTSTGRINQLLLSRSV